MLSNNKTQIESIRLKDLLEKEEKIDLLKIDIEGAEYDVLLDCKDNLDNIDNLFVEYHSWNNRSQKLSKILKVLEENKFRYYIESVSKRKKPFINKDRDKNMDLQLNILPITRKINMVRKRIIDFLSNISFVNNYFSGIATIFFFIGFIHLKK